MNTQASLQIQAISAAKRQDWSAAAEHNQAILDINSTDIGALNRLGVAQIQLKQISKAKATFSTVLELDKSNTIAKKHLARLKTNQIPTSPSFSQVYFIEEPGKTKIIELHRLAGKQALDKVAVGQKCELKPKNRYISVEVDGIYLGSMPEDISFRLTKLIGTGNLYDCYIHSYSASNCSVYVKEALRSPKNEYVHSFPITKNNIAAINDLDDDFLLEDNIPVEIGVEAEMDDVVETDEPKPHIEIAETRGNDD